MPNTKELDFPLPTFSKYVSAIFLTHFLKLKVNTKIQDLKNARGSAYKIHKTSFRRKYLIPTARQCIFRDENALLWAMGSTLGTLNISVIFLMFWASQAITNAYLNTVDMYNLHLSWKQIPQFIMEESVTLRLCSWMHTLILWALSLTIPQLLPFSASHVRILVAFCISQA